MGLTFSLLVIIFYNSIYSFYTQKRFTKIKNKAARFDESFAPIEIAIILYILQLANFTKDFTILNDYFEVSHLTTFIKIIILIISYYVLINLSSYLYRHDNNYKYANKVLVIYLFTVLGSLLIVSSLDLLSLFLSLELFGLGLYTLVALQRYSAYAIEASIKYFIQNSFASILFIFGTGLYYYYANSTHFIKHTLNFNELLPAKKNVDFGKIRLNDFVLLKGNVNELNSLAGFEKTDIILSHLNYSSTLAGSVGILFISLALLTKIGAAPFYLWLPDVYEGAPLPITMYLATAVKLTYLFVYFKILYTITFDFNEALYPVLIVVAGLSTILGAIQATVQTKIKRFLAYSSISHTGLILFALSFIPWKGAAISFFTYTLMYLVATVIIFNFLSLHQYKQVIGLVEIKDKNNPRLIKKIKPVVINQQIVYISDLANVKKDDLWLRISLYTALLSLAGIPPFGGFVGKLLVLYGLVQTGNLSVIILFVLASTISVIYYIRLLKIFDFVENTSGKTPIIYKHETFVNIADWIINKDRFEYSVTQTRIYHITVMAAVFLSISLFPFLYLSAPLLYSNSFVEFDYTTSIYYLDLISHQIVYVDYAHR